MGDRYPPAKQRAALLKFAAALGSRSRALRPDECGDPRITGKAGHVYAVCGTIDEPKRPGFMIYAGDGETANAWNIAKRDLSFAKLVNDGDAEGCLFLDRLPAKAEADIIRKRLAIPKRRTLTDEQRQQATARLAAHRPQPTARIAA
jgi:hypothetical protein